MSGNSPFSGKMQAFLLISGLIIAILFAWRTYTKKEVESLRAGRLTREQIRPRTEEALRRWRESLLNHLRGVAKAASTAERKPIDYVLRGAPSELYLQLSSGAFLRFGFNPKALLAESQKLAAQLDKACLGKSERDFDSAKCPQGILMEESLFKLLAQCPAPGDADAVSLLGITAIRRQNLYLSRQEPGRLRLGASPSPEDVQNGELFEIVWRNADCESAKPLTPTLNVNESYLLYAGDAP